MVPPLDRTKLAQSVEFPVGLLTKGVVAAHAAVPSSKTHKASKRNFGRSAISAPAALGARRCDASVLKFTSLLLFVAQVRQMPADPDAWRVPQADAQLGTISLARPAKAWK